VRGDDITTAVVLLVIGALLGAWQLAIITNWRGYGEGHVSRSIKAASPLRRLPFYRHFPPPESRTTIRFTRVTQKLVAAVFLLVGVVLVVFAVVILIEATGE
jgi:hypothetical protein